MVLIGHLSRSDRFSVATTMWNHAKMPLVVSPWEPGQSRGKNICGLCTHPQLHVCHINTSSVQSQHTRCCRDESKNLGGTFLWCFFGSHRRRWGKKAVDEGRRGWMYSYLTVTSSVNLSTRCVRMLRGSVLPPSCLGGGLLFRHAGRVELHGKRRACTERQKKTGLTCAAESNWQKTT